MIKFKRFFEFFPPPRFLLVPAVGLDISDRSIRFAEFAQEGSRLVLASYGEEKLPEGLISSGEIQDRDKVREALQAFKDKYDLRFVRASLPEQKGFVLELLLPTARKRELRGGIELALPEHVPLSPQSSIFDYHISRCGSARSLGKTNIGVTVMPQETADTYAGLLRDTGLEPLSFELEAHGIARVVIPHNSCGTFMVVDIGANRTGIFVVSDGILQLTFTVAIGGNLLTQSIAKALGVSFAEAKQLKEHEGFEPNTQKKEILEAAASTLSALRDEIRRHYIFWQTHTNSEDRTQKEKVGSIILCGGEVNVPGLRDYLSRDFDVLLEVANPWRNITSFEENIPSMLFSDSLRYATALGLALRSFL